MRRFILFLIRRKLGVRKFQAFRFVNQASPTEYYYFSKDELVKVYYRGERIKASNASLNWMLHDDCKVVLCSDEEIYRSK